MRIFLNILYDKISIKDKQQFIYEIFVKRFFDVLSLSRRKFSNDFTKFVKKIYYCRDSRHSKLTVYWIKTAASIQ